MPVQARFPLIVAEGHDLCVVHGEDELNQFEQVDIENGEYRCWDRDGVPFKLTWDSGPGVATTGGAPELPELMSILRRSARQEGIDVGDQVHDPIEVAERIILAFEERRSRTPIGRLVRWTTDRKPTVLRATCEGVVLSVLTPLLFGLWPTFAQALSGQGWNWTAGAPSGVVEIEVPLLVPGMLVGIWTSVGVGVLMHSVTMIWEKAWPIVLAGTLVGNGCVYATTWVGVRLQRRVVLAAGAIIWLGLSVAFFLMIQRMD